MNKTVKIAVINNEFEAQLLKAALSEQEIVYHPFRGIMYPASADRVISHLSPKPLKKLSPSRLYLPVGLPMTRRPSSCWLRKKPI